jgi:hypothetical protein
VYKKINQKSLEGGLGENPSSEGFPPVIRRALTEKRKEILSKKNSSLFPN